MTQSPSGISALRFTGIPLETPGLSDARCVVSPRGAVSDSMIWSIPSRRRVRIGDDHWCERPITIPQDLDRADSGQHGLHPGSAAHVLAQRGAPVVVPEVLGQFRVQHGLKRVLRELDPHTVYQTVP